MPWTISHAAAILPFIRFCRTRRQLGALAFGSMSPDFGYYLGSWGEQLHAHTIFGVFTVCLPLSCVCLLIAVGMRRPLVFLLSARLRTALMPLAQVPLPWSLSEVLVCCIGIVLGALTHLFWDAWTHYSGGFVQYFAILRASSFAALPNYRLLQHLSTAVGLMALLWRYRCWSRAQDLALPTEPASKRMEQLRFGIYAVCIGAAVLTALAYALPLANAVEPNLFWRVLMFQCAIIGTRVGVGLGLIAATLLWFSLGVQKAVP
jgi:hypothetical protein